MVCQCLDKMVLINSFQQNECIRYMGNCFFFFFFIFFKFVTGCSFNLLAAFLVNEKDIISSVWYNLYLSLIKATNEKVFLLRLASAIMCLFIFVGRILFVHQSFNFSRNLSQFVYLFYIILQKNTLIKYINCSELYHQQKEK